MQQRIIPIELSDADWALLEHEVDIRDAIDNLGQLISKLVKNEIDRRVR